MYLWGTHNIFFVYYHFLPCANIPFSVFAIRPTLWQNVCELLISSRHKYTRRLQHGGRHVSDGLEVSWRLYSRSAPRFTPRGFPLNNHTHTVPPLLLLPLIASHSPSSSGTLNDNRQFVGASVADVFNTFCLHFREITCQSDGVSERFTLTGLCNYAGSTCASLYPGWRSQPILHLFILNSEEIQTKITFTQNLKSINIWIRLCIFAHLSSVTTCGATDLQIRLWEMETYTWSPHISLMHRNKYCGPKLRWLVI